MPESANDAAALGCQQLTCTLRFHTGTLARRGPLDLSRHAVSTPTTNQFLPVSAERCCDERACA
jgi:hypothetical protein